MSAFSDRYLPGGRLAFTKTNIVLSVIGILIFACGPHPSFRIQGARTPQNIWEIFQSRYNNINSLALQGSFTIKGRETHEISLQTFYSSPDSFAFLAEGTLGTDIARGAMTGDSGFWEIPHEKYYEPIQNGDTIVLDEYGTAIDISELIRSIFFFKDLSGYHFESASGAKYLYKKSEGSLIIELYVNKDTATPVSQTAIGLHGETRADYYDWKFMGEALIMPGSIKIDFPESKFRGEYKIRKAKKNPLIPSKFYLPMYKF